MSDEREDRTPGSDDHDAATTDATPSDAVPTDATPDADGGAPQADATQAATDEDDGPADGDAGPTDLSKPAAGATARPAGKRRARRDGEAAATTRPGRPTRARATTATSADAGKGRATRDRASAEAPARRSPLARLRRFLREVVAELRKVIWPTRNQLVTYTTVVLVFVSFMVALVAGLDIAFARGVLWLFG